MPGFVTSAELVPRSQTLRPLSPPVPPPPGVSHSGRFCSLYAHLLLEKSHKHAGGATVGPGCSAGHGTVLWPATPAGPSAPAPSSV